MIISIDNNELWCAVLFYLNLTFRYIIYASAAINMIAARVMVRCRKRGDWGSGVSSVDLRMPPRISNQSKAAAWSGGPLENNPARGALSQGAI